MNNEQRQAIVTILSTPNPVTGCFVARTVADIAKHVPGTAQDDHATFITRAHLNALVEAGVARKIGLVQAEAIVDGFSVNAPQEVISFFQGLAFKAANA